MAHTDTVTLFDNGSHKNILLEDFSSGLAVQANQYLVIDGQSAIILDPGGHKVYSKVLSATTSHLGGAKLEHIFLSHQDPDIVAALNGWLMTTDATAHVSQLWQRFVPHFGVDRLVESRLLSIPDAGQTLRLGSTDLLIVPAHFLHSPGNFHLYDPVSKTLFTGDLGASVDLPYREVTDFDAHAVHMRGFHRRYMASNKALRAWCKIARKLDVDIIAPQHGAFFRGKDMCARFIDWCETIECGADIIDEINAAH